MWIFEAVPAYIWAPILTLIAAGLVIGALKALASSRR
jgi:hypothetical protein